ncbi:MAG: zf-HC2 domain-containing protein, partial [Elusimicrobia bacterium]|nr:zf-HC2 domain-containing protein [Elusimicrobiota bacterium]
MNCDHARRMISDTLDGAAQDAVLSRHLAGCAACSRSLAFSRSLNAALVSLPQPRPGAAFSADVLALGARRPAAAPVWPFAAALAASSAALA